jgi:dTDP-4-amino-4,6-dideoxygalactose transaminase
MQKFTILVPIHLQKAAKFLNYKKGDFPVSEELANTSLSLPVHEFIKKDHIKYVVKTIEKFYKN